MRATLKLASLGGRIGSLAYLLDLAEKDLTELGGMPEAVDAVGPELETMALLIRNMNVGLYSLSAERTKASDIIRGGDYGQV